MPLITPSYADRGSGLAGRITFLGATSFSESSGTPFTALQPNSIPSGYIPVPFGAADTAAIISTRIAGLINAFNSGIGSPVSAAAGGSTVALSNGSATLDSPAPPLVIQVPAPAATSPAWPISTATCTA